MAGSFFKCITSTNFYPNVGHLDFSSKKKEKSEKTQTRITNIFPLRKSNRKTKLQQEVSKVLENEFNVS